MSESTKDGSKYGISKLIEETERQESDMSSRSTGSGTFKAHYKSKAKGYYKEQSKSKSPAIDQKGNAPAKNVGTPSKGVPAKQPDKKVPPKKQPPKKYKP